MRHSLRFQLVFVSFVVAFHRLSKFVCHCFSECFSIDDSDEPGQDMDSQKERQNGCEGIHAANTFTDGAQTAHEACEYNKSSHTCEAGSADFSLRRLQVESLDLDCGREDENSANDQKDPEQSEQNGVWQQKDANCLLWTGQSIQAPICFSHFS